MRAQYNPCTCTVNQKPHFYGGQQEAYRKGAEEVINKALDKLRRSEKTETSFTSLFFEVLGEFAKARQKMAMTQGTNFAKCFGNRRETSSEDFHYTFMDQQYSRYNIKILENLSIQLSRLDLSKKENPKEKLKVSDQNSSFEIEIIEQADLTQRKWDRPLAKDELPKDFPCDLTEKRIHNIPLNAEEIKTLRKATKALKESNFEIYRRSKMVGVLSRLQKEFPSPIFTPDRKNILGGNEDYLKSFFAISTTRLKVQNPLTGKDELCAASQYVTWLYRDFKMPPLERMKKCSVVMIIHQDGFLTERMLTAISKLFAKAVLISSEKRTELTQCIGTFRKYYAEAMPHERGDAAINEWFECLLYAYHGYDVSYKTGIMPDVEALATPLLSQFLKNYDSMIQLKPMQEREITKVAVA